MQTDNSPQADMQEYSLNGVRCAQLRQHGRLWRLGSRIPAWRAELPLLGEQPAPEALAALAAKGIWLNPAEDAAPLAVLCCGQGAVWPHMGRELYDRLPAARAAMDRLAAIASWDVLSLLDEHDVETIGQTRWQQPYLFLLQYAQWSYFSSLGLAPRLMAGHSLGEMIALCFAGAYTPETAWNMIDTRARHTADIEAASTRGSGMMAVHADETAVRALLAEYPDLYVSNYNAPTQVILSGPRDVLTAARKALRKQRVPAMLLNVSVAFHNPAMRVLHNTAIQRLRIMEMRPEGPRLPVMSNTTAGLYPFSRDAVCEYISVLDENSVRWVECVRAMWGQHGIRHFLETGPQDTLCGLVSATQPEAVCIPAVKKGRELEGVREAVARLYALGHIPRTTLLAAAQTVNPADAQDTAHASVSTAAAQPLPPADAPLDEAFMNAVLDQLAATLELPRAEIRPEQDLRQDLGLRSSRFPLLLQDAEQRFGITIRFEAMLNVLTVGDFAAALHGILHPEAVRPQENGVRRKPDIPPMRRWRLQEHAGRVQAAPAALDPLAQGLPLHDGDHVVVFSSLPLLPQIFTGLAALGCSLTFITPAEAPAEEAVLTRDVLEQLGGTVRFLTCAAAAALPACHAAATAHGGQPDGLIVFSAPADAAQLAALFAPRWLALLAAAPCDAELPALIRRLNADTAAAGLPARRIILPVTEELRSGRLLRSQYAGDMLVRELLYGEDACLLWARHPLPVREIAAVTAKNAASAQQETHSVQTKAHAADPVLTFLPAATEAARTGQCARAARWPLVWPDAPHSGHAGPQPFEGQCQFSAYADTALAAHSPCGEAQAVPPALILETMLEAACQNLPWLKPTGMADIRWTAPLTLTAGVTRECSLNASTSVWFRPDGHFSRFCPVQLRARDLSANGRRTATSTDIASAFVLLAPQPRRVPPLWDMPAAGTLPAPDGAAPAHTTAHAANHRWTADMPPTGIAPQTYSGYAFPMRLLEAALALTAQALRDSAPENFSSMRLEGIGFLYFSAIPAAHLRLEARRTFLNEERAQFDVQGVAADGTVVLTCNTIEYLRHAAQRDASVS